MIRSEKVGRPALLASTVDLADPDAGRLTLAAPPYPLFWRTGWVSNLRRVSEIVPDREERKRLLIDGRLLHVADEACPYSHFE